MSDVTTDDRRPTIGAGGGGGELPRGWTTARIEDICEVNPRERGPLDPNQPVSFVPMPVVSDTEGIILEHGIRPFSEVAKGYTRFRDGDVIFAKITPCMENGKIAIAKQLHNGIACGSTEFHVLRCSTDILPEYLWRFLRQEWFREDAKRHMAGAVGQQRVPGQYVKDALIPLPPLAEQRRIVARLDALFARTQRARAELERVPKLVKRAKQAVLSIVSSPDTLSGFLDDTTPKSFKFRDVISSLRTGPFGSSLHKSDYIEGGIPIINPMHINSGRITPTPEMTITDKKAQELDDFRLKPGDVVLARRGVMGRCAVVEKSQTGWLCGTGSMVIHPSETLTTPAYLQLFLSSPYVVQALESAAVGSTMINLNQGILLNLEIRLPSLDEQAEIIRRIEAAFARIERMAAEAARATALLERLEQATLAQAFRGELR